MAVDDEMPVPGVTIDFLLHAFGSAVLSLRVAPAGTGLPIRSVALLDADDLAAADRGVAVADLCVLAGVSAQEALSWIDRLATNVPALRPSMLVIKEATPELCRSADGANIAVGSLHLQARADMVLTTVRSLLDGAAGRVSSQSGATDLLVEESDLYGLAQRVAAMTGGLVSIEDDQSRLLAYSATDGSADELRMLSILGREGPAEHLLRLRELGIYDRLRRSPTVVEVPADEVRGWHRRLAVGIRPLGGPHAGNDADSSLGTIWLQEGSAALDADAGAVLIGAAAIAARFIHRARTAPTQEAMQIQRLLGLRGGGVDIPTLASALALPSSGPAAVIGIAAAQDSAAVVTAEQATALRLLAGAYARDCLVTATDRRLYLLVPRARSTGLITWVTGVLDRLDARFDRPLRAAIAAPVPDLKSVSMARAEVDRVLDRAAQTERVTSLTQSRTPVLLGEIADLLRSHGELKDPRLQRLRDHDQDRETGLVQTLETYLDRFGDVRSAAADLHIHPNTLRYRIRRAQEVLGMDLDEPDNRLLLQLQLLISRYPARQRGLSG